MAQPEINWKPINHNELQELIRQSRHTISELEKRDPKILIHPEYIMLSMISEILFWRSIHGDPMWDSKNGYRMQDVI